MVKNNPSIIDEYRDFLSNPNLFGEKKVKKKVVKKVKQKVEKKTNDEDCVENVKKALLNSKIFENEIFQEGYDITQLFTPQGEVANKKKLTIRDIIRID